MSRNLDQTMSLGECPHERGFGRKMPDFGWSATIGLAALLTGPALAEAPPRPRPPAVPLLTRPQQQRQPEPAGALCGDSGLRGERLPAIAEEGDCGVDAPMRLVSAAGVALEPPAVVACETAHAMIAWLEGAAITVFAAKGVDLEALVVADAYSCRNATAPRTESSPNMRWAMRLTSARSACGMAAPSPSAMAGVRPTGARRCVGCATLAAVGSAPSSARARIRCTRIISTSTWRCVAPAPGANNPRWAAGRLAAGSPTLELLWDDAVVRDQTRASTCPNPPT